MLAALPPHPSADLEPHPVTGVPVKVNQPDSALPPPVLAALPGADEEFCEKFFRRYRLCARHRGGLSE